MKGRFSWNDCVVRTGILGLVMLVGTSAVWSATHTVKKDGTGNFATIQAAVDAAQSGDTIEVYAGTYTEDVNIGHINMPPARKDNLTVKAAAGAEVEIVAANNSNRVKALAAAGADFGAQDRLGFFIYGKNIVLDGLKIVQSSTEVNALNIAVGLFITSSNVTVRNCDFSGPGKDAAGDIVGAAITPLDVVTLQTKPAEALAGALTVENCSFHDVPYAFANANFPAELGLAVPSADAAVRHCEFTRCNSGVEVDAGKTTVEDCSFKENNIGLHLSDEVTTIAHCLIEENLEHGIEIDDSEVEDGADPTWPKVTVNDCYIADNGTAENHYGIRQETGTLDLTYSILRGNSYANLFLDTENDRETVATVDHCDFYQSATREGIVTTATPQNAITLRLTNSIIVDDIGIINNADVMADVILDHNDIFTVMEQFQGPILENKSTLKVDPKYVNPAQDDFRLQASSPLVTAGIGGTYLGSDGVEGAQVENWMRQ